MSDTESRVMFPPVEFVDAFEQFAINDAWFSGDVDALQAAYAGQGSNGHTRGDADSSHYNSGAGAAFSRGVRRAVDRVRSWFVGGRGKDGEQRTRVHSPLAGNLAALSADVLLSVPPTIRLIKAGKSVKGPAQDRLDELVNSARSRMSFVQAAEFTAGLSASVLTVNWNAATTDAPWLAVTPCDAAVPRFADGRLESVTLWTVYPVTDAGNIVRNVYTHSELHERGQIVHTLYKSTGAWADSNDVGRPVPLAELAETAHLARIPGSLFGEDGLSVILPTGTDKLTATYWRNLPTKRFRRRGRMANLGRADFEGVEHLLDQIDMVWSSWMRDIKLARARLIIPEQFLEGGMDGPTFDDDREILTALQYAPEDGGVGSITAQQFQIRAAEHQATILELTKDVLQHAGYSLSSYGEHGDSGKTATEVVDRTTATERTRDKKALYFTDAITPLVEAMLEIDRIQYHQPGLPADTSIEVKFTELSQIDPEKQARTFGFLRSAQAASTETIVRELHPDWDDVQVSREVARIQAETGIGEILDPGTVGRTDPAADDAADVDQHDDDDAETDELAA